MKKRSVGGGGAREFFYDDLLAVEPLSHLVVSQLGPPCLLAKPLQVCLMLPSSRAGLRQHFSNGGAWEGLGFNGAAATKKITSVVHYEDPEFSYDLSLTSVGQLERMIRAKMVSSSKDDKTMNRMSMMNKVWAAFARAGGSAKKGLTIGQVRAL
jgi:hypothetical protein